jgi:ribose-phosphate pyrophosphokinase
VVVAADLGFAKKGRNLAMELDLPLALVEKRRAGGQTASLSLVGDVAGCDVIIVDDEIDTASSMESAVEIVQQRGARTIYLACVHPLLSPPAVERLRRLPVAEIIATNSVRIPPEKRLPNMTVLSVAPLLGEVIRRVHEGSSVGAMFQHYHLFR